jgi:[lysine-biosynthesis-protein LysW]--L-2-aminoadipate ligase
MEEICLKASRAVGGGVLAVDVIEHPERGMLVNEVNHTMEFHTVQPLSGIDIADTIVGYTLDVALKKG